MGKTRHCFKKLRDTKRTFHAKMDTIKHYKRKKCKVVIETEEIKKRWQGYT